MHTKYWSKKPSRRDNSEYRGVAGRIILECILGKMMRNCELDSSGLGQGSVECSCESRNEISGSKWGWSWKVLYCAHNTSYGALYLLRSI